MEVNEGLELVLFALYNKLAKWHEEVKNENHKLTKVLVRLDSGTLMSAFLDE